MVLGYANFIIVPFANIFGRRPTILICGLICIAANIWQARVASYASFLGARAIGGLGAAANESIMPMVISDVMFLHQRGVWMGLYLSVPKLQKRNYILTQSQLGILHGNVHRANYLR